MNTYLRRGIAVGALICLWPITSNADVYDDLYGGPTAYNTADEESCPTCADSFLATCAWTEQVGAAPIWDQAGFCNAGYAGPCMSDPNGTSGTSYCGYENSEEEAC